MLFMQSLMAIYREPIMGALVVCSDVAGRLGDFLLRPDDIVICTDADGCKVYNFLLTLCLISCYYA